MESWGLSARTQPAQTAPGGIEALRRRVASHLQEKYALAQGYFYTREVNEILAEVRAPATVRFRDLLILLKPESLPKRFYPQSEAASKLSLLIEYYKYHDDVPRLFMHDLAAAIHNFYDKKRRINYIRITKMLKGRVDAKVRVHDSESSSLAAGSVASSLLQFLPEDCNRPANPGALSRSTTILDLQTVFDKAFETAPPPAKNAPPRIDTASPLFRARLTLPQSRSPAELKGAFAKPGKRGARQLDLAGCPQTRTLPQNNSRTAQRTPARPPAFVDSYRLGPARVGRVEYDPLRSAKFKKFIQQERTLNCRSKEPKLGSATRPAGEERTFNARRPSQCAAHRATEQTRPLHTSLRQVLLRPGSKKPAQLKGNPLSSHDLQPKKACTRTSITACSRSPTVFFQTKRSTYDDLFSTHKQNFRTFAAGLVRDGAASGEPGLFDKKRSLHDPKTRARFEQSIRQKICRKNTQLQLNLLEKTVSNSRPRVAVPKP